MFYLIKSELLFFLIESYAL